MDILINNSELTVSRLLEVDVGVPERPPGDHVPAHSDGEDGARGGELLEEHGLGDLGCQVPHIETRHRVVWPGLGWGSGLQRHLSLGLASLLAADQNKLDCKLSFSFFLFLCFLGLFYFFLQDF